MKKLIFAALISCCTFSLSSQVREYFPLDTINFEYNTWEVVIDTTQTNNIWQVGVPSKAMFDQAFTGSLAIVTDTLDYYPISNISSFHLEYDTSLLCGTFISFMQKFDTDTLQDYCSFEYSIDTGQTWFAAKDTFPNEPWYCEFYWNCPENNNNSIGYLLRNDGRISGKSDDWIESVYHFQWLIPLENLKDSGIPKIMFRFKFTSDETQTNKEGWMIDQIILGGFDCWGGIDEKGNISSQRIEATPNPAQSYITFKNLSKTKLKQLDIYNSAGKRIFKTNVSTSWLHVQTKNLGHGLFLWKALFSDTTTETGKIIINQ